MRTTFLLAILISTGAAACQDKVPEPAPTNQPEKTPPPKDEYSQTDVVVGTGAEAKDGSTVKVHYTGTLKNGTKFDSSRDRNEPFEFTLGKGQVIRGWDQGVVGMKVGGKRKLVIPSELGYGDKGSPPKIPPKATLLFDVELISVK
jgi:FKBP-type peptidyl-prolyl cis-trans isomerase